MMPSSLSAHGDDPGPSQRPLLAGAISGILGTVPAIGILVLFGSLKVEAGILGLPSAATLALGWAAMGVAGAAYARFFGRAANSPRSGWLFGMSFSFALWAGGAVLVLPLFNHGRAPAGDAAAGIALSMIVWGLAVGLLVPFVHRPLHESIERASKRAEVGPSAAVRGTGRIRDQEQGGKPQ